VVSRQNVDIADTLKLRDVAIETTFWLPSGYNFGCMAASDSLFGSRWGFGGKLSDDDIAEIEGLRYVAMATNFGTKIDITGFM